MKLRSSVLALLAAGALTVPAFAFQNGPLVGGEGGIHPGTGGSTGVRDRVNYVASFPKRTGIAGKVKAATAIVNEVPKSFLSVQLTKLAPSASYTLVINGIPVGSAVTNAEGRLGMVFESPARGAVPTIPEAVLPLRADMSVQIVLTGTEAVAASSTLKLANGDRKPEE